MRLSVNHVTVYRYDTPVRAVVQSHRLTPSVFDGQKAVDWNISVSGGLLGGGFRDGAGDYVQGWTVAGPLSEITVTVQGTVDTRDLAGMLRGHRELTPPGAYMRETHPTRADIALTDLARGVEAGTSDRLALAHALSEAVSDAIVWRSGQTHSHTTAAEALAMGEGVCQDHAHALIACARLRDLPARYVSGYLHTETSATAKDAAHAWAEIHINGLGWIGFDPANRCCPDERYIRLGSGDDAQGAAPIRGTARGGAEETLDVSVAVSSHQQ
ncbi:MAG: transglutaminase family protein [Gemmobacter sp.]|nr:transglutaminase family protein [Gemmobacter sp.]